MGQAKSINQHRLTPVLLLYHMQQQSAVFHAADAASVGGNIRKVMHVYIRGNDENGTN